MSAKTLDIDLRDFVDDDRAKAALADLTGLAPTCADHRHYPHGELDHAPWWRCACFCHTAAEMLRIACEPIERTP